MYPEPEESRKCYLSCLYSNVNSLKNKRNELEAMIDEKRPGIIGLTEVWMKEHYSLPGYHLAFRHDRDVEKREEE